jgi:hypothetical protein
MRAAYTSATGRTSDFTNEGAGDLGGLVLLPGVHTFTTGVRINSNLVLSGTCQDVFVFQVAYAPSYHRLRTGLTRHRGTYTQGANAIISLVGGVRPSQVFWAVAGAVTVGDGARFMGVMLAQTSITFQTGGSAVGRLLAQSAITLDKNSIEQPNNDGCSVDQTVIVTACTSILDTLGILADDLAGSTVTTIATRTVTANASTVTLPASTIRVTSTINGVITTLTSIVPASTVTATGPTVTATAPTVTATVTAAPQYAGQLYLFCRS